MTETPTPTFATRLDALGIAAPVIQQNNNDGELIDANGVSLLQIDTLGIREDADVKAIADLIAEAINAHASVQNAIQDAERLLDIPAHLKPAADEIVARWRGRSVQPIADELAAAGLDSLIAANLAIHVLRTDCARWGVVAAHCYANREPRRDWWLAAAGEDFDAATAWYEKVSAELDGKPAEDADDTERCIACDLPIEDGDPVYNDADGGTIHAACAGTDRASFTGPDGEPLKDGEPIPEPWIWRSDEAAVIDELLRDDPALDRKSTVALIAEAEAEAMAGGL